MSAAPTNLALRALPDDLVTRQELAVMMRCSVRTVDKLKRQGMPSVSWGCRLVRFRPNEAMMWAEARANRKVA